MESSRYRAGSFFAGAIYAVLVPFEHGTLPSIDKKGAGVKSMK